MWTRPPPPGFQGLRDDLPLTQCHQTLPHWRQSGATYFVTYHLFDSLPQPKLRELEALKGDWERKHPEPRGKDAWDDLAREAMRRADAWLDQGIGGCQLKSPEISQLIADAMHRSDGSRCELGCYIIMPNHVHVVLRPLAPESDPLEMILKHWKASSLRSIEEKLKTAKSKPSEMMWHRESFDHIVRDAEQLWRILQHIGSNPKMAGLPEGASQSWVSPAWIDAGWRFEIGERGV
ncbi:MAG: hypothetical protein JWM11_4665 [Planctomycetaceae bacterium]|nr:hypothetical protein [Planctomycetaceae bacterium]